MVLNALADSFLTKSKKSVGLKGLRKYQIIYQGRGCIKPAVAAIIAEVRGKFG